MRYWIVFVGKLAIIASIDGLRNQGYSFAENKFKNEVAPDMVCYKETTSDNVQTELEDVGRKLQKDEWIVAIDVPEVKLKMKL